MAPAKRELLPRAAFRVASRVHTLAPASWAVRAETRAALPLPTISTSKVCVVEDILELDQDGWKRSSMKG